MKKNYNYSSKTTPLSHQIDAINYIKSNSIIPLFDEQGLGKTKSTIDALCYGLEQNEFDSTIVVCSKTLLKTWAKEIEKHSYLDYTILDGSRRRRGRSFMHVTKFYLINYESVLQEMERMQLFLKLKKFAIVLDESQKIKNPNSKITQALLSIKDIFVKKIIITGTPIDNRPADIWSQYYFLDDGKTLGSDYNEFKRQFNINLRNSDSLKRYKDALGSLKRRIKETSIRRTKDVLEIPEKIYHDVLVKLSGKQMTFYHKAKEDLIVEIKNMDGDTIEDSIDNILVKMLRLTQIASNPKLLDEQYDEVPAKFIKLDEIIDVIIKRHEKAIIWTCFRKNVRLLRNRYKKYNSVMIFGEMTTEEKNESIAKFQDSNECRIMVANPAVASVGLTLTSSNNAIYIDRNFKMGDYIQSQDRIHRIGQTRKCTFFKIIAKDTIDQYTDDIIEKKHIIAQYALGDKDNLESKKQFLTKEEILNIIG